MICKQTIRNYAFRGVTLCVGAFVVLIALSARAQMVGSGQKALLPRTEDPSRRVLMGPKNNVGDAGLIGPTAPFFFPAVAYDSGGQLGWSVAVADINHDGKQDAVVVNYGGGTDGGGTVGVLLGNGDGTFQPVVSYNTGGGGPTAVAIGDLNREGKADLIVANQGCPAINTTCLSVLLGNGDGTFQPAVIYPTGGFPIALQGYLAPVLWIVDLNGDSKPDLALGVQGRNDNVADGGVTVLLGNGDGTFQPMVNYDSGGLQSNGVAMADLNGDGKPDFVVLSCAPAGSNCPGNAIVGVLLGRGDGTLKPVHTYATGGPGTVFTKAIVTADINGDGKPDILVGNSCPTANGRCSGNATAGVLIGKGDGTFHPVVTYDSGGFGVESIAVADLNGDGKPDLIVPGYAGVGVMLGNGDGTFGIVHGYFTFGATAVLVADVNHDDKPDLIVPSGSNYVGGVLLGNGDGTFKGEFQLSLGGSQYSSGLAVADVNGDERPDLLTANWCAIVCQGEEGTLAVLLNNKDYVFSGSTTVVASSANPGAPKKNVTYTATVTTQSGGSPVGEMIFEDSGVVVAVTDLSGNQVVFTTKYQTVGSHTITAIYSGDSANAGSTSLPLKELIKAPSQVLVTTSGSPSHVGQPVTFTATVTSHFGSIPDGELVTFSDGNKILGSAPLSNKVATFTTSSLSAKQHTIKAIYPGDENYYSSHRSTKQIVSP